MRLLLVEDNLSLADWLARALRQNRYTIDCAHDGAGDCVTILVSHRFSTVRMADFIVVLRGSRVIESGTHEALLATGGHYAELYRIQAAAYR